MFKDRKDAGQKLAKALEKYRKENVLVLAIPRGGVEVGFEVAKHLDAEFSIVVTRKLPFPFEPEAGFGAIAEDGSSYIDADTERWELSSDQIKKIIKEQKKEIERRIKALRNNASLPVIRNRTVILVDDGIAMGSTMRASIKLCKKKGAKKIIVAVPVTGSDRAKVIGKLVSDIVVLETPPFFHAVAQVYDNWYDVPDEEVIAVLKKWRERNEL